MINSTLVRFQCFYNIYLSKQLLQAASDVWWVGEEIGDGDSYKKKKHCKKSSEGWTCNKLRERWISRFVCT